MTGPFNITQVDAPGLLQMYDQRKRQGLEDMYRQRLRERQDKLWAREDSAYERGERKREGLTAAYDPATGKIDKAKARNAFLGAGDIEGVLDFDDKELARQKGELETFKAVNQAAIDLLGGVSDQASYTAATEQAKAIFDRYGYGNLMPQLPPTYSPETVMKLQKQALSSKERLEIGLREAAAEEQRRHNRATEGNAARGLNLRERAENRITKWGPQPLFGGMPINPNAPRDNSDLNY